MSDQLQQGHADERLAALRGQKLPRFVRHQAQAVIHGIRHHLAFAQSPAVVALCQEPGNEAFARARHARLIMSDIIPDMGDDDEVLPYCIWHPQVAAQYTYRQVARRYPRLKYHVARACAVAGYAALYKELDVLPEVAVAEEAQASEHGAEIFRYIMTQPLRYAVMNDYENTLYDPPRPGARLNADTAVASILQFRSDHSSAVPAAWPSYWDIEQDGYIGEENFGHCDEDFDGTVTPRELELLGKPLPADLPTVNKDVLILMAAYEGNMDRYERLARPVTIPGEAACIARGIYHNTCFAKWASAKQFCPAAVNARRTMVNDLSWLTPDIPDEHLPYMIWYPLRPNFNTLFEIVRREPRMWVAVAHACIACNVVNLFDMLLPRIVPTRELLWEAEHTHNQHFKEALVPLRDQGKLVQGQGGPASTEDKQPTDILISGYLLVDSIWEKHQPKLYAGYRANAADLELYLMTTDKIRAAAAASEQGNYQLYHADDGLDREWDESIFDMSNSKE